MALRESLVKTRLLDFYRFCDEIYLMTESEEQFNKRVRARELAAEYAESGNTTGWFEALYKESGGDTGKIPGPTLSRTSISVPGQHGPA